MNFGKIHACDRSSFVLDSIVYSEGNYRLYATLCIGGGILGSDQGAGNWTESLYFFAWGPAGMSNVAYGPDSITSDTTHCTLAATPLGPLSGLPLLGDVDFALAYLPISSCQYACISSNGICGLPHTDCKQLTLTFTEMPDSILMLGAEGAGNLFAGCWPQSDLMIDFSILPLTWGSVIARQVQNLVQIDWVTEMETNNDHFELLRSKDGENWREIGRVPSRSEGHGRTKYALLDPDPYAGTNYYQVVQVDENGKRTASKVVSVKFQAKKRLKWLNLSPNPGDGAVNVAFFAPEDERMLLELLDADGRQANARYLDVHQGENEVGIAMGDFSSGVYVLRLSGNQGTLQQKLLRF